MTVDPTVFIRRVSDASGELKFTEEAQGRINKSMFDSNDAFVFDAGHEGQWISYYHLIGILNQVAYHVGTCINLYCALVSVRMGWK